MSSSAFLSRWTQSISRFGRDGMTLSKAIYMATKTKTTATSTPTPTSEIFKSVLLDQARHPVNPNTVATSYLRIEKVYGLIRYLGFNEYMKQKVVPSLSSSLPSLFSATSSSESPSSTSSSSSLADKNNNNTNTNMNNNNNDNNNTNTNTNTNTAKIAFMITSSMKRDLIDGLGYSLDTIKGMKPQQASLVLHHRIDQQLYQEQIIVLEKEFDEEQRKQQQQQQQKYEEQKEERESERQTIDVQADQIETTTTTTTNTNTNTNDSGIGNIPLLMLQSNNNDNVSSSSSSSSSSSYLDTIKATAATATATAATAADAADAADAAAAITTTATATTATTATTDNIDDEEDDNNHNTASSNNTSWWYEVVEVKNDVVTRHGLYRNKDEAIIGLETRQLIHDRQQQVDKDNKTAAKTTPTSFIMRPISDEEIRQKKSK